MESLWNLENNLTVRKQPRHDLWELCSKKAATAPRQPTERKPLFKATRGHDSPQKEMMWLLSSWTNLRVTASSTIRFTWKAEAPEGETPLCLGSGHPGRLHWPRPHDSILHSLGMFR